MFFLGIDIGKNNHVASMMNETGNVVFKAFSFPNTSEGGQALFSKLSSYSSNPIDFEIGMEATGHYWLSITGIDNVTGAAILSEIGDIAKFNNPKKLVAFAGIDASVSQSGKFASTHNVMSKRGSPYLLDSQKFSANLIQKKITL